MDNMKKYTKAVERRLNLPKELKKRVMSDFLSSIEERREAGQTEEEIRTELGTPKMAAAELNEQMKEFTYRKSPWRFLFAVCAIYGCLELLGSLVGRLLYLFLSDPLLSISMGEASSAGIIGGADGPTAIFVTTPGWTSYVLPALLLLAGVCGYVRLSRCRRK